MIFDILIDIFKKKNLIFFEIEDIHALESKNLI